jgi:Arylsulfatase regulator (Fe-S oxidoreductase)
MDIINFEKNYKNSKFSNLFKNNNAYCICHSLTTEMLYGDEIIKRIYDSFNDYKTVNMVFESLKNEYYLETLRQIIFKMIYKGLLIDIDEADVKSYIKKFNLGIFQYKIQNTYFLLTSECNLRCKYCFVEDDNRNLKFETMTLETAKKSIDVFAKLTQEAEPITITFYGGEPLLNKEVLYATMKYIRILEMNKVFSSPVQMTLITNGLLIDDETIKVLKETDCNVSVSIDGPQIYHDACRKDIVGKGSFERVLNGFNKLKSAGLDVGVSCTLNKFNIEHVEEI